jgi:hypothetical protein
LMGWTPVSVYNFYSEGWNFKELLLNKFRFT